MSATVGTLHNVFADTAYWIALVVKQDQHHERAQAWTARVKGRICTTSAVFLETANALARPTWRATAIALIDHVRKHADVEIVPLAPQLCERGWELYRNRPDKAWSLTDCISFLVMEDGGLTDALTSDDHFRQANFRAVLLEDPTA